MLNEGSYGENNAHLGCFNFTDDRMYGSTTTDIYEIQNGRKIGDTGQDIIAYKGSLYMAVYNSNYVVKLNGVGKEEARVSFASMENLGQVRGRLRLHLRHFLRRLREPSRRLHAQV